MEIDIIDKIDKHVKALIEIVDADKNTAMSLQIVQGIDDDNIEAYTVSLGNSVLITSGLYTNLKEQIENGATTLFLEIEEMLQALREEMEDNGIDLDSEPEVLNSVYLH